MNSILLVSATSGMDELSSHASTPQVDSVISKLEDLRFFRTRLILEPDDFEGRQVNWSAVWGIGLATLFSLGIWAVVAMAVAHVWK